MRERQITISFANIWHSMDIAPVKLQQIKLKRYSRFHTKMNKSEKVLRLGELSPLTHDTTGQDVQS